MGSKANFLENEILDHIVNGASWTSPGTVYSALFTIIPSDSTGGTEVTVTDSAYTRVATSFSTAGATATGQVANTAAVNFTTVAAGDSITIVGWALMTDSVTGAMTRISDWEMSRAWAIRRRSPRGISRSPRTDRRGVRVGCAPRPVGFSHVERYWSVRGSGPLP